MKHTELIEKNLKCTDIIFKIKKRSESTVSNYSTFKEDGIMLPFLKYIHHFEIIKEYISSPQQYI